MEAQVESVLELQQAAGDIPSLLGVERHIRALCVVLHNVSRLCGRCKADYLIRDAIGIEITATEIEVLGVALGVQIDACHNEINEAHDCWPRRVLIQPRIKGQM